jgi:uncharacterized RDD family membrane protein YckC
MRELRLTGASLRRRALAAGVDGLPCVALALLPWVVGIFAWGEFVPPPDRFWPDHLLELLAARPRTFTAPLIWAALVWCLWQFLWVAFAQGRTPGCALLGVRYVDAYGDPPRWDHALLRAVGGVLSAGSLGLGWAWGFVAPSRRTWPDLLSGTWLVRF